MFSAILSSLYFQQCPRALLDHWEAEREEHPRHRLRAAQEELRQVKMEGNIVMHTGTDTSFKFAEFSIFHH